MLFEFTSKSNRRGGPLLKLAEERGFEPRRPREEPTHFPGVPVQPLLHSSIPGPILHHTAAGSPGVPVSLRLTPLLRLLIVLQVNLQTISFGYANHSCTCPHDSILPT